MQVISSPHEIYARLYHERMSGRTVGLVPTMGALHAGHISLVEHATNECDITAASIFVNPTQFAPTEDLAKYPRTLESDLEMLAAAGADYVFAPTPAQIYPPGFSTFIQPPAVALPLEGKFRPVHFQGVTTVVAKLFMMLPATMAYFGRKDYQQQLVIRRMVDDLNIPIRIVTCPTMREPDGLAMSSRNRYLSKDDRFSALGLWHALQAVEERLSAGKRDTHTLNHVMHEILGQHGIAKIDYACVVDAETLEPIEEIQHEAVALIAAFVGNTRLIDNLILDVGDLSDERIR